MKRALSRRAFLRAGAATGAALIVGFHIPEARPAEAASARKAEPQGGAPFAPNAFIPHRSARHRHACHAAGGDRAGRLHGGAMILADELDADWQRVRLDTRRQTMRSRRLPIDPTLLASKTSPPKPGGRYPPPVVLRQRGRCRK